MQYINKTFPQAAYLLSVTNVEEWLLVHGIKTDPVFFLHPHVLDNCCYSFSLALIQANCVYPSLLLMYSDLIKKRAQEKERTTIITLGRLHFLRNREKHNTGKSACKDVIIDKKKGSFYLLLLFLKICVYEAESRAMILVINWSIRLIWSLIIPVENQIILI